jgi:hypothetical protein
MVHTVKVEQISSVCPTTPRRIESMYGEDIEKHLNNHQATEIGSEVTVLVKSSDSVASSEV